MFRRTYDRIAEKAAAKMYAKLTENLPKPEKKPKKESTIKQLIRTPDDFVLTMWTDGDDVNIKLTKKEAYFNGRKSGNSHETVSSEGSAD